MATIKQISELSGVSRGTVDRVLNGRGHVSPEKERLVRSIAEQVGYTPCLLYKSIIFVSPGAITVSSSRHA